MLTPFPLPPSSFPPHFKTPSAVPAAASVVTSEPVNCGSDWRKRNLHTEIKSILALKGAKLSCSHLSYILRTELGRSIFRFARFAMLDSQVPRRHYNWPGCQCLVADFPAGSPVHAPSQCWDPAATPGMACAAMMHQRTNGRTCTELWDILSFRSQMTGTY